MTTKIIVTPINLISNKKNLTFNGKKARVDYLLELENFSKESKWDDSRYNNAVIGNMFGFVHQIEDKIEIFEIKNILPANTRPDYWNLPNKQFPSARALQYWYDRQIDPSMYLWPVPNNDFQMFQLASQRF